MSFTKEDLQTIEFIQDKLQGKNCDKLLKSLATLKGKLDKAVRQEEIKEKYK